MNEAITAIGNLHQALTDLLVKQACGFALTETELTRVSCLPMLAAGALFASGHAVDIRGAKILPSGLALPRLHERTARLLLVGSQDPSLATCDPGPLQLIHHLTLALCHDLGVRPA